MTYEQIIERCVDLRRAFERDEAKFFLGLVEVERKHMKELRRNGIDTFDHFLRSHDFCRVERYHSFVAGLQHVSGEEAERMGAPAVIALAGVHDAANVPEYKEAVGAWSLSNNGFTPRLETAQRLLRQVDPRREQPQAVKRVSELTALRGENAKLKRENARLRAQVEELEAKVRDFAA